MHFVTVERALRHHPTSWDEVREYTDTPDGSDLKALVDVVRHPRGEAHHQGSGLPTERADLPKRSRRHAFPLAAGGFLVRRPARRCSGCG
ncbi:hypothetical protein GCM10010094_93460 [Streptomyces flaveus]|uniref:Uncharacterized protein n=1 Tax=Streptomyces flaveus TaxID=66370 RepID=A0A917RQ03_9ACTN|nr:hypothetical protein GCM10010094_93460 [Streptomyces flaveus]